MIREFGKSSSCHRIGNNWYGWGSKYVKSEMNWVILWYVVDWVILHVMFEIKVVWIDGVLGSIEVFGTKEKWENKLFHVLD